ncbi:MAG TPA: hypothetical protein VHS96_10020 [Bacteroidia bacterium]|nr:hypothetical protein [Bacteroidia bacterium]
MKFWRNLFWLLVWSLLFAGRSPETNVPEPAGPSTEVPTAMPDAAGSPSTEHLHTANVRQPAEQAVRGRSSAKVKEHSLRYKARASTPEKDPNRHGWIGFWATLASLLAWRHVRQRHRRRRPNRPQVAKWLVATIGILVAVVLVGLGWLASLAILGLTFAMAVWMSLGIVCALALCLLMAVGAFYLITEGNLNWPRNLIARILVFLFVLPFIIGTMLILAALFFFLFLNVFLVPVVGFLAAAAVMGVMLSSIFLSLAIWELLSESAASEE